MKIIIDQPQDAKEQELKLRLETFRDSIALKGQYGNGRWWNILFINEKGITRDFSAEGTNLPVDERGRVLLVEK